MKTDAEIERFEADVREIADAMRGLHLLPRRMRRRIIGLLVAQMAERLFLN